MDQFVIEGGQPLRGTVVPSGNKNAALPILAACLLTAEPVVLHNVPRIRDVDAMQRLIKDLTCAGASGLPSCWRVPCWPDVARSSCRRPAEM